MSELYIRLFGRIDDISINNYETIPLNPLNPRNLIVEKWISYRMTYLKLQIFISIIIMIFSIATTSLMYTYKTGIEGFGLIIIFTSVIRIGLTISAIKTKNIKMSVKLNAIGYLLMVIIPIASMLMPWQINISIESVALDVILFLIVYWCASILSSLYGSVNQLKHIFPNNLFLQNIIPFILLSVVPTIILGFGAIIQVLRAVGAQSKFVYYTFLSFVILKIINWIVNIFIIYLQRIAIGKIARKYPITLWIITMIILIILILSTTEIAYEITSLVFQFPNMYITIFIICTLQRILTTIGDKSNICAGSDVIVSMIYDHLDL